MNRRPLAALTLLALTACAHSTPGPGLVIPHYEIPGLAPLTPDVWHESVYVRVLACLEPEDEVPSFDDIELFQADRIIHRATQRPKAGLATPRLRRIYLSRPHARDWRTVGHEYLHVFLPGAVHGTPSFTRCDPLQTPENYR